jgi:NAD(P)-dependent dehydrogenase (short-subunit alcohol dehydrogenase family)
MLCSAYCASKGAVNLFTKAMALELAPYNIRINSVCPGDILTPLTENQLKQYPDRAAALKEMASVYPLGRIGTPEEIAAVVEFLASDQAGFITGAIWTVDGGITA